MFLQTAFSRAFLIVCLAATFTMGAVSAQDVDPALVEVVSTAFAQTASVDSLNVESRSMSEVSGLPEGLSFGQEMTRTASLVRAGDAWNFTSTSTSTSTTPQGELNIVSEIVRIDDVTYIRFTDAPAELGADLPTVWTDAAELATTNGLGVLNVDELIGEFSLPITAESVTSINELATDTIDGQTMRVIQITLDPQTVLDSEASALVSGLSGGVGAFPNDGQMPQLPEGVTPPAQDAAGELPELSAEDFQITFAVYIGADDGLIHRIYRVIAVAPSTEGGASPAFTTTTLTNYTDFNTAITISAPTLGE